MIQYLIVSKDRVLGIVLAMILPVFLCAQGKSLVVKKLNEAITVDGVLNEDIWNADHRCAKDFWQYFPTDTMLSTMHTEIKMAYDNTNLYIGIICEGTGDDYVANTLKRDYRAGGNDNITLMFDTFNDGTNCVIFGTNHLGVQREGLISDGGQTLDGFSTSWDNKWRSESKQDGSRWTAELEIPFSILRFNAGVDKWRFNSYRFDTQSNENATWMQIPRNQWIFNLAYMGDMIWEEGLHVDGGSKVTVIPFATTGVIKDYEADTPQNLNLSAGLDAKIAVSSGLNLDLTLNPDFSQVEVDQQITNLDRFEIFFPERRQFFLENADLFGSFGTNQINPFFSRRIGVATDTRDESTVSNTIYGGARLSGKVNEKLRVGLLSMQTASDDGFQLPTYNYTVAVAQRKLWSRSNMGFIVVNKQAIGDINVDKYDENNRVIGFDFNFANKPNTWVGKTFYHQSISSSDDSQDLAHGLSIRRDTRKYLLEYSHEYVGADYEAQVGFVRRNDYLRNKATVEYRFYPENTKIGFHRLGLMADYYRKNNFGLSDHLYSAYWNANTNNNERIEMSVNHQYIYLFEDFDPSGTESTELAADTDYGFFFIEGRYNSDNRKNLGYSLRPYLGQYFNGHRYGLQGNITYRLRPYGSVSVDYALNAFDLPHLDGTRSTFLIGPKLDWSFTKDWFLSTFVQYNSQSQNTNVNTRLQWRFAPVSDFFLVYTDNYFTGSYDAQDRFLFGIKNRSIVAKVTYWLNM